MAGQRSGQGDVLGRGQRRDQVEGLEHEADPVPAQPGQSGVVQGPDVQPAHERVPGRGPVQARHAVHERRLARARRAHDGGEPAALEGHRDTGQGVHRRLADPVRLGERNRVRRRRGLRLLGQRRRCGFHISPRFPLTVLKLLVPTAWQQSTWRASTGQPVRGLNRAMDRTAEAHPPID
jgi:hypothetical protein